MPLPQETIAWLHQAARLGQAGALADLDALARLDALEARVVLLETTQHAHIEGPIQPSALESLREPASIERLELAAAAAPDTRDPECVMRWPDCYSDGYDPRCCRFPKSCSCGGDSLATAAAPVAADGDEVDLRTFHGIALDMVETLPILPEIKRTLRRAIREPMEPAAAAAAPVATDDELTRAADACRLWRDSRRALYNLGRQHGTPPSVVDALREAEAVLIETLWVSGRAAAALPTIRAALQLLGQPAPAAAPETIKPELEAQSAKIAAELEGPLKLATAAAAPVTDVESTCLVDQIRRHAPMEIGTAEAIIYVVAAWLDRRGNRGSANELREEAARQEDWADV